MNIIKSLLALIKKEQLELVRDQRSLLATFAYALVGPLLLYVIIKGFIATATEQTTVKVGIQENIKVTQAIADVRHFLHTQNIETVLYTGQLPASFTPTSQATSAHEFDVLIRISQPQNAVADRQYSIAVFGDQSTQTSNKKMAKAAQLMSQFVAQQQRNALLKQGVMPANKTWTLHRHVVNQQTVATNKLMDSLLIFLLLAPFFITLNYINDATAGERERGSLMPLLTQPINRGLLVLSKWSVGSVLGIVGSIVTMVIGFKLIADLPIYEIGLHLDASLHNMALTVAVIAPLALMVTSLQMWIALSAKSFKEGQSYLTLFSFIPMIAVFMAAKFENQAWSPFMPLVGHQQMLQDIYTVQVFDSNQFLGLSLACIIITLTALQAVRQQLNSEAILQGR